MKVSFLMWLTCGICAADTLTSNVRVSLQFIGMAHPVVTELLKDPEAGGAALHAKAMALAKQGKAEIVETCVLTCRSGEGASAGSLREEIFPTEFGTLEFPDHSMTPAPPPVSAYGHPMHRYISAFETRNAGVTLEIKPTIDWKAKMIDLHLISEIVRPLRFETWTEYKDQWGDASRRMPIYETCRTRISLGLRPGKFQLVSAITPRTDKPVPAADRRILLFVRADVVGAVSKSP